MTLWINQVHVYGSDEYTVQCGGNVINKTGSNHVGWTITNSSPCYFQSGDFKVNFEDNNWKLIVSGSLDKTYDVTNPKEVADEGFGNYAVDIYWIKNCFSIKPQKFSISDIDNIGTSIYGDIVDEGIGFFIHLTGGVNEQTWESFLEVIAYILC